MLPSPSFNSLFSLLHSLSSGHPFLFPSLAPLPPIHTWMYMVLRIRPQSFLFSCFTRSPWTNFSDFMTLAVTSLVIPLRSLSQWHNYLEKHFDRRVEYLYALWPSNSTSRYNKPKNNCYTYAPENMLKNVHSSLFRIAKKQKLKWPMTIEKLCIFTQ